MSKKRLTRLEMAAQLREEAAELLRLAAELEGSRDPEQTKRPEPAKKEFGRAPQIVRLMAGKMRRKAWIAEQLKVTVESLDTVMTRENGFFMNAKGWWEYRG